MPSRKKKPAKTAAEPSPLLYADTRSSEDQLYFGRFPCPDPFISFGLGRRKVAVLNALEFGRGVKSSRFDEVLALEEWQEKTRERFNRRDIGVAEVIATLAESFGIDAFKVPHDFPAGLALKLLELGVTLEVVEGLFFPEREFKSEEEASYIAEGNAASARGIAAAERVLRQSKIQGRRLVYQGKTLTSEILRHAIDVACLEAGAIATDTIAAGGDQACDPHERGSGPLRPDELIIVDVFPRVAKHGYHGDMTRTFLKGKASDAQRQLVAAVAEAQRAALGAVKAGVTGKFVHQQVLDVFARLGYQTTRGPQGSSGFFHGTGHGLGLAVHEPPRMNPTGPKLRKGQVVTVEPGLYYPGLGGARIEDVVLVTATEPIMLSNFHYKWEIR
jgi:Xaa-Pro aminopeptidase